MTGESYMPMHLYIGNWLVGVVGLAVGEKVVDEHADDGEEEDDKGPKDLVGHWAVGLEDLDYRMSARALK
jgi:hypothetical protein